MKAPARPEEQNKLPPPEEVENYEHRGCYPDSRGPRGTNGTEPWKAQLAVNKQVIQNSVDYVHQYAELHRCLRVTGTPEGRVGREPDEPHRVEGEDDLDVVVAEINDVRLRAHYPQYIRPKEPAEEHDRDSQEESQVETLLENQRGVLPVFSTNEPRNEGEGSGRDRRHYRHHEPADLAAEAHRRYCQRPEMADHYHVH